MSAGWRIRAVKGWSGYSSEYTYIIKRSWASPQREFWKQRVVVIPSIASSTRPHPQDHECERVLSPHLKREERRNRSYYLDSTLERSSLLVLTPPPPFFPSHTGILLMLLKIRRYFAFWSFSDSLLMIWAEGCPVRGDDQ